MNTKLKLGITTFLFFLCFNALLAQNKRVLTKESGTTKDFIELKDVKKGGEFLYVESFIEEYNTQKAALTASFKFKGFDKEGRLLVKYAFSNKLLNFKINTVLALKNWETLNFVIDSSRLEQLEVKLKAQFKDELLIVE